MKSTSIKPISRKNNDLENIATTNESSSIRILKIATCPSLSGNSTLTYHIGCKGNSPSNHDIQFRIYANTERGFFSKEWVSTTAIQKAFEKLPTDTLITSSSLIPIFQGRSVNTSGFLLAVLKAERLICPVKGKRRYYQRTESEAFVTEINGLIASSVALKTDSKLVAPRKQTKNAIQTGKARKA
jgi:hypothetical protein